MTVPDMEDRCHVQKQLKSKMNRRQSFNNLLQPRWNGVEICISRKICWQIWPGARHDLFGPSNKVRPPLGEVVFEYAHDYLVSGGEPVATTLPLTGVPAVSSLAVTLRRL